MIKIKNVSFNFRFLLLSILMTTGATAEEKDWVEAIKNGDTKLSVRTRLEMVDQDGFDRDATAQTILTRLSFSSKEYKNWRFNIEFDNVSALVEDFNSTANGKGLYPVVADPEGADLNQVNIHYKTKDYSLKIGRQRINVNDQRLVGGVAWRQNEQTFDSIAVDYNATSKLSLGYSYIHNINRIFGPSGANSDIFGTHHLLTANYKLADKHKLNFTGLLFDPERAPGASHSTYLFEYKGAAAKANWRVAYATQSELDSAAPSYDADYQLLEFGYDFGALTAKLGLEVLGSDDGNAAFATPLATLHKFQGFADKFLATPATGVEDTYVSVSTKLGGVKLGATYHDYSADFGGASYGDEINLTAAFKASRMFNILVKYASYSADTFQTDTDKIWIMTMTKF